MELKRQFSSGFGIGALAFALSYAVMVCLDPMNFPIRSVNFIGQSSSLSFEELQEKIIYTVDPVFFRLKIDSVKEALLALPWVKDIDVHRVWPDKLVVEFKEHIPVAKWGEQGMISSTGEVFFPNKANLSQFESLPMLQGPRNRNTIVWEHYLAMKGILTPHHLEIVQLTLAPRGSWHLKLNNGIQVNLGTDDILKRLKRFVRVYHSHLQSKNQAVAYVDLRYTSGLAVGWKTS